MELSLWGRGSLLSGDFSTRTHTILVSRPLNIATGGALWNINAGTMILYRPNFNPLMERGPSPNIWGERSITWFGTVTSRLNAESNWEFP